MNQFSDALSALTKLSPDNAEDSESLSASVYDHHLNNIVSGAFNKISQSNAQYKDVINTLSQSPHFTSDPQKLLALQDYLGEYSNHVSLVSTLARKGVSTIETLVKS